MTKTYTFHAWCIHSFIATFDIEADTPDEALTIGRTNCPQRLDTAYECRRRYPWDGFAVDDKNNNDLLHGLAEDARLRDVCTIFERQ
jgi:hypothetical protein